MSRRTHIASAWALVVLLGAASGARAESVEDRFRAFLDKVRGTVAAVTSGLTEQTVPKVSRRTDGLPLAQGEFVVFVSAGCGRCNEAVALMKKRRYDVTVMDVGSNDVARQAHATLGTKGLPVILLPNAKLEGFTPKALDQLIVLDRQVVLQRNDG